MRADADDLELPVGFHLAHDGDHLAGADVETHYQISVGAFGHTRQCFLQASVSSVGLAGSVAGV